MKSAIGFGLLMMAASASAQSVRPAVEHFPAAPLSPGQPAPYASAVRVGDMLYLSGQTGDSDGELRPGFEAQAHQSMDNIGTILKQHGLGFGDVVKCTVMLADMKNWPAFNAIYVPYFPTGKLPARSAIGANGLAQGALIEVECWAYAGKK
jgi:2-iminobutanoate/2-iminopropanoate deaminase